MARGIAKQASIFAHLKQVKFLSVRRSFKLQQHFATKTDVLLRDGHGIPSQAALSTLFDAGIGIFKFELGLILLLFKLHQRTHTAQFLLNSARGGKGGGLVSQLLWLRHLWPQRMRAVQTPDQSTM